MWHHVMVSRTMERNRTLESSTVNSRRWRTLLMSSMAAMSLTSAAACSGGGTTPVEQPSEVTVSDMASPTDPVVTSPPTSVAIKDVPDEGFPQAEIVDIYIDADDGSTQQATVPLGSPVNVHVRSSREDEFHLHGYDIELRGIDVTFSFTADRLGSFELEGHDSGRQLLILTVFED